MLIIWLQFIICLLLILYAGSRVSKYGDVIAEKSGLGQLWIGFVVLAVITSLPEFANSISAVTFFDIPDLSVSNIFGACMLNIFAIGLLNLVYGFKKNRCILNDIAKGNLLTSEMGIILMSLAALAIFISQGYASLTVFGISLFSFLILAVFLIGNRMIFNFEKKQQEELAEKGILAKEYEHISNFEAYSKMVFFALIVIAVGAWLPYIGEKIAIVMGFKQTFVGSFFLAVATVMPEFIVSFFALRLGAINMAVGNLLGSYAFNISILPVADILYRKGSLFAAVSSNNISTALVALLLMGIAIIGIKFKPKKKILNIVKYETSAIIAVYLVWLYFAV
ncbi:sodium:calcium antiporter [Candidatus Margulisiibacteriota bacterium]